MENWAAKKQELRPKKQELGGKKQELEPETQELPKDIQQQIKRQGKKAKPEEMLRLVEQILASQELSTSQLARFLDRTPEYVRCTYLKPLVEQGRIAPSNPENPTDPNQTYRTAPPE